MADKNIVIDELEDEVLDEEMETPNPEQETPAVDQKPKGGFINGCKKVGRIAEAGFAIFGGAVAALMIVDGVKASKRRKSISAAPTPQITQIPESQNILDDVKVDITKF